MKAKHIDPEKTDALLEAEACGKVIVELDRLIAKYERKVEKESAKRRAELETAMEYRSEDEIRDAYGWAYITQAQMERYIDLLRQGEAALEDHTPTVAERTVLLLCRLSTELAQEQQDYRYQAMSLEEFRAELKRQEDDSRKWKEYIDTLKKRAAAVKELTEAG